MVLRFRTALLASGALFLSHALSAQSITNGVTTVHYATDTTYQFKLTAIDNIPLGLSIDLAPTNLWTISFFPPGGAPGSQIDVTPDLQQHGSTQVLPQPGRVTMRWLDVVVDPVSYPNEKFEVLLTIALAPGADYARATLRVKVLNANPVLSLWRAEMRLGVSGLEDSPTDEWLAVPWFLGTLHDQPRCNTSVAAFGVAEGAVPVSAATPIHPGSISLQFAAYYNAEFSRQLFWGTRDTQFHTKAYGIKRVGTLDPCQVSGLEFFVQHYMEDSLQPVGFRDVTVPFPMIFSAREGSWYEAARYYRAWAIQQPWALPSKNLESNPMFSSDFVEADAYGGLIVDTCPDACGKTTCPLDPLGLPFECAPVENDSLYSQWTTALADLQSLLGVTTIGQKPFFWDFNGFSACFGDWFPIEPLFASSALVAGATHPIAPYFNNTIFCTQAPGFTNSYIPGYTNLSPYVIEDELGQDLVGSSEFPNRGCSPPPKGGCCGAQCNEIWDNAHLCFGTSLTADYSRHIVQELVPAGANGLYLDVYHVNHFLCFADEPEHTHAPGGGNWWAQGMIDAADATRDQFLIDGVDQPFLWTEGATEHLIGIVEGSEQGYGGLSFGENSWRVPLFSTVYNDYIVGARRDVVHLPEDSPIMQPSNLAFARQTFAAVSYEGDEPSGGLVLTSVTPQQRYDDPLLPDYDKLIDFIASLASVENVPAVRDLVRFGERLRDPVSESPVYDMSAAVVLPLADEQPVVYTSLWGRTGEVCLLVVNWTSAGDTAFFPGMIAGSQSFDIDVNLEEFGFQPSQTYTVDFYDQAGTWASSAPYTYPGGSVTLAYVVPELSATAWIIH